MTSSATKFLQIALAIGVLFATTAGAKELTLLYTNDIESVYEPVEAFWNDNIEFIGGIPKLSTLIGAYRDKHETSFLLDAGDIFTGSLCKATKGEIAFDIYSTMGYDAVNIGNHEFEYGWEILKHVQQRARFPLLNANLFYQGTDINFGRQYAIVERNGVRLGLIGILGIDAFHNATMKSHRDGLEIREAAPIVQSLVNELQDDVDMIVVITHQNRTAPMQSGKEADQDVQRGYNEDFELAGAVNGIDMIIGGHSDHGLWQPVRHPDTGTWIGQTFGQGQHLGVAHFEIDDKTGRVNLLKGSLVPVVSNELESDPRIVRLIESARAKHPHLATVLGHISTPAVRAYNREANIGNLLADALRSSANADIGLITPGAIRVDLNAGPVTAEELQNVFPFTDQLMVLEISGETLSEVLEHSFSLAYGLAQLSGIKVVYDSDRPQGQRLVSAEIGGRSLDTHAMYTLATLSYHATGGDGYKMLETLPRTTSELSVAEAFAAYFESQNPLVVPRVGRQTDLSR